MPASNVCSEAAALFKQLLVRPRAVPGTDEPALALQAFSSKRLLLRSAGLQTVRPQLTGAGYCFRRSRRRAARQQLGSGLDVAWPQQLREAEAARKDAAEYAARLADRRAAKAQRGRDIATMTGT